jgi:serine/threonine protein kinase
MQGMRFLHAANPPIVHGDLKSANVLVDGNFRAKIADFGLTAKRRGRAAGTPFFMAPELLRGGATSTQSDVYAFGVLLWEVITHKFPYEEIDLPINEILEEVREGKLRSDCDEGLDKELVECVQDCWAQEADQRPSLEDLEIRLIPLCSQNLFLVMQEKISKRTGKLRCFQDVFPEQKGPLGGQEGGPWNSRVRLFIFF